MCSQPQELTLEEGATVSILTSWLLVLPQEVGEMGRDFFPTPSLLWGPVVTGGSDGEEPACDAGDLSSIPGSGRSPGGGHGNPLQYSCMENPMDRGAWRATVHGVAKSQT